MEADIPPPTEAWMDYVLTTIEEGSKAYELILQFKARKHTRAAKKLGWTPWTPSSHISASTAHLVMDDDLMQMSRAN